MTVLTVERAPAKIKPLLHPNVEIMIATAMIDAPDGPKITSAVAEPTRSEGTVWIPSKGNATR